MGVDHGAWPPPLPNRIFRTLPARLPNGRNAKKGATQCVAPSQERALPGQRPSGHFRALKEVAKDRLAMNLSPQALLMPMSVAHEAPFRSVPE